MVVYIPSVFVIPLTGKITEGYILEWVVFLYDVVLKRLDRLIFLLNRFLSF